MNPGNTTEKNPVYWFFFFDNELMVNIDDDSVTIPYSEDPEIPEDGFFFKMNLGTVKQTTYIAGSLKYRPDVNGKKFIPLRGLLGRMDDELFLAAGRSYHLLTWNHNHQFCGRCGSPVMMKSDELAKYCPSCALVVYPRISPAVIVAVTKGDQILLAHSGRFKNKMYSVLAGFVEPGETFEECIVREILEEVNISVYNIKYFGSQPWPFPDSIMVGFTAEYKSGEIKPDGKEILEAGWFSRGNTPELPGKWSIARKLIDQFLNKS